MQNVIQLGQVQPSVLSRVVEGIVKNWKAWLSAKSETFSSLCGEDFTHREVLLANLVAVAFIIIIGVAGWLEGGAA